MIYPSDLAIAFLFGMIAGALLIGLATFITFK